MGRILCDLYWFVLGMMTLHYTPFSYNGCGWRYTNTSMPPEKQILRFRPGVRRSLNPGLIHSIHPTWVRFSNLCLKNYPLNKKLTFTHFQWDPTTSNSMAQIFLSFSQGEKLLLFQLDPRSVTSFPAQLRFLAWQCHGQTWCWTSHWMVMGGCQRLQCVPEKHFPTIVANKNILYSWGMGYHGYQHWYMTVQRLLSPVMTFPMEIIQTWGLWTEMSQLGTREWTALIPDIWLTWTISRSLWYPSTPNGLYKENALTFFLSTLLQKFKTRLVWPFGEDEIRSENKGNGGILC